MNKNRSSRGLVAALLPVLALLAPLGVAGCTDSRITAEKVRADMSPGLETLTEASEQRKNRHAKTWDVNTRQIWDDIDMILFDDRPLHLTKSPIP